MVSFIVFNISILDWLRLRFKPPSLQKLQGANGDKAASHCPSKVVHSARFICILLGLMLAVPFSSRALTNSLALTPPMGWNSWNHYSCNISDAIIRNIANAMATNGMKAAGYQFINIDDCWQVSRDTNGVIVPDPTRFPNGIKALADYVHSKGLKLGVYSDHGISTCQGRPGGLAYEYLDANTYAAWAWITSNTTIAICRRVTFPKPITHGWPTR